MSEPAWREKLEHLYRVFSRYPLPEQIPGCPCCVGEEDQQKLHSQSLRELSDDDLGLYATKAMTTWGGVDDYRHFLPRLFELSLTTAHGYLGLDADMIGGKLGYGDFSSWPEAERRAVEELLDSLEPVVFDDSAEDACTTDLPPGAPRWSRSDLAACREEIRTTTRGFPDASSQE